MSIRQEFAVHRLNSLGMTRAEAIAEEFSRLMTALDTLCPASREKSLVVTKLQEAAFWAKRAIAVIPENQETRAVAEEQS